jgi:hypothetical protein
MTWQIISHKVELSGYGHRRESTTRYRQCLICERHEEQVIIDKTSFPGEEATEGATMHDHLHNDD